MATVERSGRIGRRTKMKTNSSSQIIGAEMYSTLAMLEAIRNTTGILSSKKKNSSIYKMV
jgi:hypothetical protein